MRGWPCGGGSSGPCRWRASARRPSRPSCSSRGCSTGPRTRRRSPTSLEGGALAADGRIEASADVEPALRFADGTVIALARGTKGRLASVDGRGAHVAIADGTASVNVVPKPHARWRVDAGPFVINVHGTVFSAAWNEATGRLDVKLERGSVSVEGPVTGGPIAMRAGQRLTVAMHQSRVLLRAIDDHEGDVAESDTTTPRRPSRRWRRLPYWRRRRPRPSWRQRRPRLSFRLPRRSEPRCASRAPRGAGRRRWPRETLPSSSRRPSAICRMRSRRRPPTIWRRWPTPLATGVRTIWRDGRSTRNGGGSRARRALRTPPSSSVASTRSRAPAWSTRCGWYDRYLDEAPSGSYVAEALGRKMVAVRDLYGVAQARTVADEYVRRFPHGSYAGAAQALRDQAR